MPNLPTVIRRGRAHIAQRRRAAGFAASLDSRPREDLICLGDLNYGGYMLPESLLGEDSVCYLAGTGEDISFDLGVIARFGCRVYALDPVPPGVRENDATLLPWMRLPTAANVMPPPPSSQAA